MLRKFVLRQLFDVRPLKKDGSLDLAKMEGVKEVLNFKPVEEIEFIDNQFINRDDALAELIAFDKREQGLKNILSHALDPKRNGQIVYIKNKIDPRKRIIRINRLIKHDTVPYESEIMNPVRRCEIANYSSSIKPKLIDFEMNLWAGENEKKEEQIEKFFENKPSHQTKLWCEGKPLQNTEKTITDESKLSFLRKIAPTMLALLLLLLNLFLAKDFLLAGLPISLRKTWQASAKKININLSLSSITSFFERPDGEVALLDNFTLLKNIVSDYGVIFKFLGFERQQKYLLIFQNNSEIRPTGGFIGSYGILDIDRGKIKNFFIDDIYNIDGQLQEKIAPPAPLLRVADFWSMHDANWYADFPASAKKVAWFYEKTGGPTVDGVISLTPTVVEKILKLTGPIELPEYELTINSDNFVEILQYKIEKDFDKDLNQPKKILADFGAKFFTKLQAMPKSAWPEFLAIFNQMAREKHILFYFTDEQLENFMVNQNWAGELKNTNGDYLSVVNANIAGGKTDLFIKEKIEHQAEIQADGTVIDTVKIFRYHQGGQTGYDYWNMPNTDYLRIYVPKGAVLAGNYKGVEISEENGATVFAKWAVTNPGETSITEFSYSVPIKFWNKYNLFVQKQSGSLGSEYKLIVKTKEGAFNREEVLSEDKKFEIDL